MNAAIKIKRSITVPVFKMTNGQPVYFRCASGIFDGKALNDKKAPKVLRAEVFDGNLKVQGIYDIILPTIAYNEISQNYGESEENLVGKCFGLTKTDIGKKYNAVDLCEIEDPAAGDESEQPAGRRRR